ncbi:MAG: Hpt domain-containing protein, partial [Thermodesulfobacteriota bacterium]
MSQDFMDPELFADFIVEAKEHLETIEPNLLELEKNPDNLGLLNEIFRPMHSLKGASGFLGLNQINGLAHRAENILDELRKGKIAVTAAIMDVILAATDALRTMIDSLETQGYEGEVETASIIHRIEAILAGEDGGAAGEPETSGALKVGTADVPEEPDETAREQSQAVEVPEEAEAAKPSEGESRGFALPPAVETGPPYGLQAIGEGHLNDFLEEAQEIIENLNSSLLELEKDPAAGGELVNDIFRYFHNLKGNSGIIGHKELNALTHEAETLLNKVRKGEMIPTPRMIDLLLGTVDMMETLVSKIDAKHNQATPLDISILVDKLQQATATGDVDLSDLQAAAPETEPEAVAPAGPEQAAEPEPEPAESAAKPAAPEAAAPSPGQEIDEEDTEIFEQTVTQLLANIDLALSELAKDSSNKDYIDGLYRTLDSLRNSSGYMGFSDLKLYAERTAGLVDQARKSGLDFELMLDILSQECGILSDMARKAVASLKGGAPEPKPEEKTPAPKVEPAAEAVAEPAPAPPK